MRKVYLDRAEFLGAISVSVEDAEVILAGTTMFPMSAHIRNEEYQKFADNYDIHFIFDDSIPDAGFFTVPHVDIMAIDSRGGFIGTVGRQSDLDSDAPICYINQDLECFLIAENGKQFMSKRESWHDNLKPFDEIIVYRSKTEAEKELEFIDLSTIWKKFM